ncbi:MAG: hypothetical protein IPG57_16090 [Burkholderiales bacterium]|nr:hypothetical protein [Burkholderiales bacterium]
MNWRGCSTSRGATWSAGASVQLLRDLVRFYRESPKDAIDLGDLSLDST